MVVVVVVVVVAAAAAVLLVVLVLLVLLLLLFVRFFFLLPFVTTVAIFTMISAFCDECSHFDFASIARIAIIIRDFV